MRTTLDVADDVLLAVKTLARRERRTAGDFSPLPPRGPVVSNELIERLRG